MSENPLAKEHSQKKLSQEANLYLKSCLLKFLFMFFLSFSFLEKIAVLLLVYGK